MDSYEINSFLKMIWGEWSLRKLYSPYVNNFVNWH